MQDKPSKGWKDHFLRSGVPLEYQVARIFSDEDMMVEADFGFVRRDAATAQECSADLVGSWYGPRTGEVAITLRVIAECKYRSPDQCVLFLPDPNTAYWGGAVVGRTVAIYDQLVADTMAVNAFKPVERALPFVYKGVELHEGGAVEEDLRHGIQQLRYAAPAVLKQTLDFAASQTPEDAGVVFLAKIFVTNAPLRVLNEQISLDDIRAAATLDDISQGVETVVLFSDYGPDYEDHIRSVFRSDDGVVVQHLARIRTYLASVGKDLNFTSDPVRLWTRLARAHRLECRTLGTRFFVTTVSGLPKLLKEVREGCKRAYQDRTMLIGVGS